MEFLKVWACVIAIISIIVGLLFLGEVGFIILMILIFSFCVTASMF
jgi:hypothetical protein